MLSTLARQNGYQYAIQLMKQAKSKLSPTPPAKRSAAVKTAPPAVAFENVSFTYPNASEPTLANVSFTLNAGTSAALIGPNGSGKTTCLMLMIGFLPLRTGAIKLFGKRSPHTKKLISGVFQKTTPDQAAFPISVREFVALGGIDMPRSLRHPATIRALAATHLSSLAAKPMHILSSGQKQRMLLARALVSDTPIMLFDEPTANLDETNEHLFYTILKALQAQGKTILLVSHDMSAVPRFTEKILCINKTLHEVSSQNFNKRSLKKIYSPELAILGHSHFTKD